MIVYVGNMLSRHGYAPTSVETIGKWLGSIYPIKRASPYKNQIIRLLHMCWVVLRYGKRCNVLLIDTYSGTAFTYAIVVASLAKLFRIKYIPILRGGDLPKRFNTHPRLSSWFIRNAVNIVVPSAYLQHEVRNRNWAQTILIPNSIQLEMYAFKKRNIIAPKLLWVRSFHKVYNPLLALEVLKKLMELGYHQAVLCMVGPNKDGTMTEFQNRVKTYGLEEFVEVTGKLSKDEWIKKSESYSIFINTTNVDNTPISVLEAMALGLPVVSTNVGGIPYLLEDGKDALLVGQNDSMEMTQGIINLIKNPDMASYVALHARRKVEQFSWENVSNKWIELLKSMDVKPLDGNK